MPTKLCRFNPLLTISTFLILIGTLLLIMSWVADVTAAGSQPHALWNATLLGYDVGLDTWPADIGRAGYVELWYYQHDAEDVQPVLHIFGAPALAQPNTPRLQPTHQLPPEPAREPQLWA
jgi:hypothetical protein